MRCRETVAIGDLTGLGFQLRFQIICMQAIESRSFFHAFAKCEESCDFSRLPHPLAQTELDLAYVLTRWPNLPVHIRQTIMMLVRSVDSTTESPF